MNTLLGRRQCLARATRQVRTTRLRPITAVLTPHSGYHFDGLPRRFFEGWYWKVRMP